MSRDDRIRLVQEIENLRNSNVLVYFTADRQPVGARIGEDAVRLIYDHLLSFEDSELKREKLDLLLYTRGGDVSVPWRIVSMIRESYKEFSVLIPYKAYSAGTMICLGADQIVMGSKAELSPIDPTLVRAIVGEATVPPPEISVEDVSSYISFMKDRANINDQAALAQVVSLLANHLTPLTLGSVNRQYSHIRLVARKLLASRRDKLDEDRMGTIIEALTEKMYSHGHAIGRKEATELGLPVEKPQRNLEHLVWKLYKDYEGLFDLTSPIDPEELLRNSGKDEHTEHNLRVAAIESSSKLNIFDLSFAVRQRRQIPANPQINLNLNVGLPPGLDPTKPPQDFQQVMQRLLQQISSELPKMIQQEIARQSPVVGIEVRHYGGKWKDKTED